MYDVAKGRPSKIYRAMDPFQPVDTPFRAGRAARAAAWTGGLICFSHLVSVLFLLDRVPGYPILIGHNRTILIAVQLLLALIAAGLARLMSVHPTLRTAAILLIWAIVEALPFLTARLYGHAALGYQERTILIPILFTAVIGFRGALALRKMPLPPQPETTA